MAIDHEALSTLLVDWLPRQRWFGGKGREVESFRVVTDAVLADGEAAMHDVVIRVDYTDGEAEHYQLLVGARADHLERLQHALIGDRDGTMVYDATHDSDLTSVLLRLVAEAGKAEPLMFGNTGRDIDVTLHSRVLGSEQSNTSLVYGDDYILKLFRKLAPGINPDLEITRALDDVGCVHIARPLGWIEGVVDGESATLGMMQEFLRFGSEGWTLATNSVRDLYAEGDLHADEVGGDFAAESERLGAATAEVHRDLVTAFGSQAADPDLGEQLATSMRERLDFACRIVPALEPYVDELRVAYDQLYSHVGEIRIQRIHGDLHLGQVMRTENGWVLLDFEGEPARPLPERRGLASPVRDIAGMLRSFDYAARHLLMEQPAHAHLEYRATEWAMRNREAFCDGYARASGHDPRDDAELLRAFELDKAVYEVIYEARNRPTWLQIPLGTIERLAGSHHD